MNGATVHCTDDQQRRADVLAHPSLNGIDFLEVDPSDHRRLRVVFLKPLPPLNAANPADPADAHGISASPSSISIEGGTRIVGIRAESAMRLPDGSLGLIVSMGGDYSVYALVVDNPALDPVLRRVVFSFMAACPVDFDCRDDIDCPPPEHDGPPLDYLAKDYDSFRRMMLDLLPRLNPQFVERNPSDLGVALVELLAHAGDHLSYYQDAVANESFLETLRQRISARRHTKLIDYPMHDGRNAWTPVVITVQGTGTLAPGTPLVTRIVAALRGQTQPPPTVFDASPLTPDALDTDPAFSAAAVFESTHPQALDERNNEILIHAWGNESCCLTKGTSEVYLFSVDPVTGEARRPVLGQGDFLLLEEVRGPETGHPADANPAHRQVVRISEPPAETEDPLYAATLVPDALGQWQLERWAAGDPALPLLRVRWAREEGLSFPLCLSASRPERGLMRNLSVARGNVVLADHGFTVTETIPFEESEGPFRLPLSRGPLTMQMEPPSITYDGATARPVTPRATLTGAPPDARPAVAVRASFSTGTELWTPVPDLLDSPSFAQHFVAEVDNDGRAILRFGDGEYGRQIDGATSFDVVYRIGNGRAGNIGAESIAHVALPAPASWILAVRNPLPARDGVDAETIEEVRRRAPQAFRAETFRAVTEGDYAAAAEKLPEVAGSVATFRWTGSWYTVFVGIDPRDPAHLINEPNGFTRLDAAFEGRVRAQLTRYRLAGYDLEVRPPRFVPLEIDLEVCAAPGHFRADVKRAVVDALERFFDADNFTFGDPVYVSRIYAAVERVEGVESARIRTFRRYGQPDNGELNAGVIAMGPWEIARLANDPSFMEHGLLRVDARGGKA